MADGGVFGTAYIGECWMGVNLVQKTESIRWVCH